MILGDENGEILDAISENVDITKGVQGILAWIKWKAPLLFDAAKVEGGTVHGVGAGFGGLVESASGRVLLSVQVRGWENINLKSWLEEQFGLPTIVANDTVCGGFCEYCLGAGQGCDVFFYTNIGSGIGGSLFIDGKNYDGQGCGAAYFGHTYIPNPFPNKDRSAEPVKIENICSGWAIEQRLRQEGYVPKSSYLYKLRRGNCSQLTCKDLHSAVEAGDAFANAEIELAAKSFGIGLANLLTMFHPRRISIGGGVAHLGSRLLAPMECYAREYAFGPCKRGFDIVQCRYVDMAVPIGAVLMAARNTVM